jgi:hypothetical protein
MEYANGDRYEGAWHQGQRHGKGVYEYSNGDIYDGNWINDKKEGAGVLEMATGDRYEGDWADGKKNGAGTPFLTQVFTYLLMVMSMTVISQAAIARVLVYTHGSTKVITTENGMLTA